jgi:catechol 2,3-dioxygenase-like lactoylglutathione lyase family enzyme
MNRNEGRDARRNAMILARGVGGALALCALHGAGAADIDTGDSGLKVRWDNTFKYSAAFRVKQPSDVLTADANQDDGDRNFHRGLVSNRLDLLSELDVTYGNAGVRVSGAAWYDSIYRRSTDHDSPATFNGPPTEFRRFPEGTSKLHGRKAEWLDAFVFGKLEVGETSADLRAGRHTLLYGESLFFGGNGIAGTQSPLDIVKLLSVPGSPVKEIIRPVGQVSAQVQVNPDVAVGAYVQYQWEQNRLPGSGSYFSFADHLDAGGDRVLLGAPLQPGGGPAAAFRVPDQRARDGGQFGAQVRMRVATLDADVGLYATRSHARDFQLYIRSGAGFNPATGQVATYQLVYPEGIDTYGVSASRSFGAVQVAVEASVRRHTPLVSNIAPFAPNVAADNRDNPRYALGNSAHFQVSTVASLPRTGLWEGGFFMGELAWNRVTSVTRNREALDPNTTRDAWAMRVSLAPQYFQVVPGLDLTVPLGVGYSAKASSGVVPLFNPGGSHGGDVSIAVNGIYRAGWQFGVGYTHYFGRAATFLKSPTLAALNFGQQWKDRDFVSLNVQRAF